MPSSKNNYQDNEIMFMGNYRKQAIHHYRA